MNAEAIAALAAATENPNAAFLLVLAGIFGWWLINRGIIVPGVVSQLLVKIAKLEAAEEACRIRYNDLVALNSAQNDDFSARIVALEARLTAPSRADGE